MPLPEKLATFLRNSGIEIVRRNELKHATQYFLSRGPESANLTLYYTGKVVPGGKNSGLKREIEEQLPKKKPTVAGTVGQTRPALDGTPRLGIDEAGKGDYFGPLVVAGVRIPNKEIAHGLGEIGVRDSKSLTPDQARRFAKRIRDVIGEENLCVVSLLPREFERRRGSSGNVNRLLEQVDAEIIGELKAKVECVVVDQFATTTRAYLEEFVPSGVDLQVRPRADSDDAAVATASILARARYLEDLESLSEGVGFELPRGATHVEEAGCRIVREHGRDKLADVAKISFSTTSRILDKVGGER